MEQVPRIDAKEKEPNLEEKISQLRREICEIARVSVRGLFEKRGLHPLNSHSGELEFSKIMGFGINGTSSLLEDKIQIHEDEDISLHTYTHEMIHGHTNRYIHPDKRTFKSGIFSSWVKEEDSVIYFLALNEALTELLTDEALESTPIARHIELRQRLLETKKEWLPLQFEALQAKCHSDIDRSIEAMVAIPSTISDSDEDYEKWVQGQIECARLMKENGLGFELQTSREAFISESWRWINEVKEANVRYITANLKMIEAAKDSMESRLELVELELKNKHLFNKTYILERELTQALIDKIAELTNETSEVILEKMKTAYLEGNTLYFRVIGKVLGKDVLEIVAKLGDEVFEPSESDMEEADKEYGESKDAVVKGMLVKAMAKEFAKERFYKNLIEVIKSTEGVQ